MAIKFKQVTLTYVGVEGIAPQDWMLSGDGRFDRKESHDDPAMLYEEAFPHVDINTIKAILAPELGLQQFPERVGVLNTARFNWDLYAFELQMPHLGALTADFAFVQDGSWAYLVSLATRPDERDTLYEAVFLPVIEAFLPLHNQFGLLAGGVTDSGQGPTLAQQLGYTADHTLVIVHADDIGCHRDQTDGALEAMQAGMCKTGSVMAPCPDFERLASIWRQNPALDLGIHLTLTSEWGEHYGWSPVLPQSRVPSLYNPDGIMWQTESELREHMDIAEALMEIEAQILRVLEAGLQPTHIDDHMGCYWLHPDLANGVMLLARKYELCMNPVDIPKMRALGYVFPDSFWQFASNVIGEEIDPGIRKRVYDDWLRNLKPGLHQVMTHIARMTEDFASKVRGAHFRYGDYLYWNDPETKEFAEKLGITFIGYRELQRLQSASWRSGTAQNQSPWPASSGRG
jgi:predicted glycoside hydrolase/deacetylase ChbG (UPF0249 family)